jgi:hypothetical protein
LVGLVGLVFGFCQFKTNLNGFLTGVFVFGVGWVGFNKKTRLNEFKRVLK